MPTPRLCLADSYGALLDLARDFAAAHATTGLLLLAANRGAAADFLRECGLPGALGIHAMTLPQLAVQLAVRSPVPVTPLSRLSQEAMAARIAYSFRKDDRLVYFHPVADRPGFVHALASTLSELRMENVDLKKLAQAGDPARDLSLLAREYEAQLEEEGLGDMASLYHAALEVTASGEHPLLGLPALLLDVPLRHRLEKQLVREISRRSGQVLALGLTADQRSSVATAQALSALPAHAESSGGNALGRTRRRLFLPVPDSKEPLDPSVEYFSAPGEGLECVEIARRVRDLAASGVRFDHVAVLLRAPERYQPLMEEAFRRAGIPAYFHRGTARPDPAGRALLALLLCAMERCSASRFAEYLSLAQVPEIDAGGAPVRKETEWTPPQDEILAALQTGESAEEEAAEAGYLATPAGWERLLVDAAVVGGPGRWERRLKGLQKEIQLQLRRSRKDSEESRDALQRRLGRITALSNFALPLVKMLAALPAQATWGDWLERLRELAETALRHPAGVVASLEELRPMAMVGPVTLDEVYRVLEDHLRFLRREPPKRRYGHVFVAPVEEARGRSFPVIFVPGLAEGIFPRRTAEDPLLLDSCREPLPSLMRQADRVAQERLLLHIAAAAASTLVISYPRIDTGQSRPRVPSFYAIEVLRAAEGRMPELKEFEKSAAAAAQTRLGWPAPPDPGQAIDAAEFDLASLERFHRLPPARRRGAARYLMAVNPALARSLRSRWKKWNRSWSAADGLVDPGDEAKAALAAHRLRARSYSPTALQHYSACPYRFLLHSIHSLRPREESVPLEQLDPLTRGALFHEIQHELLAEITAANLLPLVPARLDQVLQIADRVLNRVARHYQEELAPAIPRVWESEIEDVRLDLRGWLRHSTADAPGWVPIESEFSFGLDETRPPAVILDGFPIRGAVDLVEQHGDELRVTDHKTGKPLEGVLAYVGGGKVLQPLLYALAVEQLLGRKVSRGRLYYCTHRGGYREIEIPVSEAARHHLKEVLVKIDGAVGAGFLPAAPDRGACGMCDFRPVCGPYEEMRTQRKQRDRLVDLRELRGLP